MKKNLEAYWEMKNPNKIFIARDNIFRNFKKYIYLASENVKNYIDKSRKYHKYPNIDV
jgi:hypothetical protein